jgi:hypothetical protein
VTTRILLSLIFIAPMVDLVAQDQQRTDIDVFPYASEGGTTNEVFPFLQNRINHIANQVYSGNRTLIALLNLRVNPITGTYPATIEKQQDLWKVEPKELAFLGGEVHHLTAGRRIIISNVYLGGDKGLLPGPMIAIRVEDDNYRSWKELHGALTLYALASDATRLGADPHIRHGYLSEAESYLAGLMQLELPPPFNEQRSELYKAVKDDLTNVQRIIRSNQTP